MSNSVNYRDYNHKVIIDNINNLHFSIDFNDGKMTKSYKIKKGPSSQNIAIKLMTQKGYNNKIIEYANENMIKYDKNDKNDKIDKIE